MRWGHVTGTKKEHQPRGEPWYAQIERENLRRVEAEWAAKAGAATTQQKEVRHG